MIARCEKPCIVVKIVNSNLKAALYEPGAESRGHGIWAFRNEIKGGTKAKLHFQFSQLPNAVKTALPFNIMGKHKSKPLSIWPTWPVFRMLLGPGHDWPSIPNPFALALCEPPAHTEPNRPGNQRLYAEVEAVQKHGRKGKAQKLRSRNAERAEIAKMLEGRNGYLTRYGIDAIRLRFEGIRIECRSIVGYVKIVNPIKVSEHVARAETDGIPLFQVSIDPLSLASKTFT